jgi:DNA-binding transcriptional LysR family regulator
MELNHLKYFHTVAKEGSFTRAAKVMRIQQPTISKMVRQLEADLGFQLLERHKKGVRLTKIGGDVFRHCEDLFARVDELTALSQTEQTECHGKLSFGMTDSAGVYLVPKVLRSFLEKHPKVRPSVFAGAFNLLTNEILEGGVEFGVSFTSASQEDYQISELVDVPFKLVISTACARRASVRSSFIISRSEDYPKAKPFPVLDMLKRHKIPVGIMISSNNLDAQKQMVIEGLGVSLLPRFMLKSELENGILTELYPREKFSYSLKLTTRKRKVLSKNAATFLDEFRNNVSAYL